MVDSTVQVPSVAAPSVQANIDAAALVNAAGAIVDRERVALADGVNFSAFANVTSDGFLTVSEKFATEILTELRAIRVGISLLTNQDLINIGDLT